MKKVLLILFACSLSSFAQNNFTQEWESPAGKKYWGIYQWESNNNVPEMLFGDVNNMMYVYDGNTKALKYNYENSDTSNFSTHAVSVYYNESPIDVNHDGVYEIIRYKTRSIPYGFNLKIINGSNGNMLYENTWANYYGFVYSYDIDGDGYIELILHLLNSQENKLVILSTTSQAIGVENNTHTAARYELEQNYPNPFNPSTIVEYSISKEADVRISVYDILGQEVKVLVNEKQKNGSYKINFDGSGLSSGTYFYQISVDGVPETKKMVLVK